MGCALANVCHTDQKLCYKFTDFSFGVALTKLEGMILPEQKIAFVRQGGHCRLQIKLASN